MLHRVVSLLLTTLCGVSVSLSVMQLRCAKVAEQIRVLFGMETLRGARHIVLDGGPSAPTARRSGVSE